MKRLMVWGIFGAILGVAGGSLMGVKLTEWYFDSPGAPMTCVPQIDRALHDLLDGQGLGALAGAVLFMIIGAVWIGRHRHAPTQTVTLKST